MARQLTQYQVRRALHKRGLSVFQSRIGSAIACCEAPAMVDGVAGSNFALVGDQALADETWGYSYGGFQIRSLRADKGTGRLRDEDQLKKTAANIDAAVTIFRQSGWQPWSTYTSGMYRAYLQDIYPPAPGTHVVLAGETLSSIAADLGGFTWQDLARLNGLHEPYTIYIGQVLMLPEP